MLRATPRDTRPTRARANASCGRRSGRRAVWLATLRHCSCLGPGAPFLCAVRSWPRAACDYHSKRCGILDLGKRKREGLGVLHIVLEFVSLAVCYGWSTSLNDCIVSFLASYSSGFIDITGPRYCQCLPATISLMKRPARTAPPRLRLAIHRLGLPPR